MFKIKISENYGRYRVHLDQYTHRTNSISDARKYICNLFKKKKFNGDKIIWQFNERSHNGIVYVSQNLIKKFPWVNGQGNCWLDAIISW